MSKKIDPKILLEEIKQRIREFYPYFLGFYLLSLAVACFSHVWSGFFYWPAFHGAVIVFTVLFLLTFGHDLRGRFLSHRASILKNYRIVRPVSDPLNKKISRHTYVLKNIQWAMALVTGCFSIVNLFVGHLIKVVVRLFKTNANLIRAIARSIKGKISTTPRRTWVKIGVIAALLVLAFFKGIGLLDFFVLSYALISFIFILDSRWAAGAALALLASCPVLLILKKDVWAENVAIYAYYFLVITVLTQIREMRRKKLPVDNCGCNGWHSEKRWYNQIILFIH